MFSMENNVVPEVPGTSFSPNQQRRRSLSSSSSSSSSNFSSSNDSRRKHRRNKKNRKRKGRVSKKLLEEIRLLRETVARQNGNHCHVSTDFNNEDVISLMAGDSDRINDEFVHENSGRSVICENDLTLSFETKVKEPSIPKASTTFLNMLIDHQHLDKDDWSDVRYADVQKLYNFSPGFTELEINEETSSYETPRHLNHADKTFAALTMCVFKQMETLQNGLRDILSWAKDDLLNYDVLHQKISALCSSGDFHKSSTDLIQLICGHRAEIIQMRRDAILKHVKDLATKSSLRKIPPSTTNLFSAEKFTVVLERAGGIKKCFWPAQKTNVTSASQAVLKKSYGPSQGSNRNFKPSQGSSAWCNRSYPHPHCSHAVPPPQDGCQVTSYMPHFNSAAPNNRNFQSNVKGSSFRQNTRQRDQGKVGRKRPLSPSPQNRDNKRRRF